MNLIRKILFPIMPIYYLATSLRNKLYDFGIKKSVAYNFPVICVGNLSTGGTGKTPVIEYLIHLLKDNYAVATLSRGYKRKTKGFVLADKKTTVELIGDEPYQFYNKFKNQILVAVDSNRNNGINTLQSINKSLDVILLDDAFQHRKVKAGFNILLTTYKEPYFKDFVLPTGNLREPRIGAERADVIIVTKCPENISDFEKKEITASLKKKSNQHVFFSTITYSKFVYSFDKKLKISDLKKFSLVTGIANAVPLVNYLKETHLDFEHLNFKDHHVFSKQEITYLETKEQILTTEKDYMRLKHYKTLKDKLFYLPIEITIDKSTLFNKLITEFIKIKTTQ